VAHGESAYFVWLNRGKESLVANLKGDDDRALIERLLERADIFVQNLAPGATERLGLGADTLRARFPRLITVSISGYGESGPYRDMKAYDMLIQSEAGLAAITGTPDGPGRVGVSVADIACGMNAHSAILEALIRRDRTGEGSAIAVSLFDALADWMAVPLLHNDYGGKAPGRVGLKHPSIAPYSAFASAEGQAIVIAIQNEREWKNFCAVVLEDADLATDPRFDSNAQRVANRPALEEIVAADFGRTEAATLTARLDRGQIAYGRLNEIADFSKHPQLRRVDVDTPTGPVAIPAPPAIVDGEASPQLGPIPAIGAQTDAIRAEFALQAQGA
jgi:crotonobetainyl-CoA:carnitine CoA-transferase CaiB-like acyl-CoA transferase